MIGVLVCAVSQSDFLYPNKFSGRDVLSAVRATVDRERQWIERYAVAKYPPGPFDPPLTIQQASAHFSFLDRFDKVALRISFLLTQSSRGRHFGTPICILAICLFQKMPRQREDCYHVSRSGMNPPDHVRPENSIHGTMKSRILLEMMR